MTPQLTIPDFPTLLSTSFLFLCGTLTRASQFELVGTPLPAEESARRTLACLTRRRPLF